MRKHMLLALMLAAALLLSSCSLIVKDAEVDANQVIIDVNGETVVKSEVLAAIEQELYSQQQMAYYYYGYTMDITSETVRASVQQSVIDSYVDQLVMLQKAKELGLDAFTEEEQAQVDEMAASYVSLYGVDEETAASAAAENKMTEKLQAHATADVTISPEELQAALDERVESAKSTYASSPSSYGYAVNNGTTVYYAPEGYRRVKHILVKLAQDASDAIASKESDLSAAQAELTSLNTSLDDLAESLAAEDLDEETKTSLQAQQLSVQTQQEDASMKVGTLTAELEQLKADAYAAILPKAQDIKRQLDEGAAFDALVAEYNEDTGMPEAGYAICENYTYFDEAFTAAGMALEAVGDVSDPVQGVYGYHIIQYAADIPEGAVALDGVAAELQETALTTKKNEVFEEQLDAWVEAAGVKTYPNRLAD